MSPTTQTLTLAGSTLAAVIITFIGSYCLLRWQARKEARARSAQAVGEVLAAATDLMTGVRVFRAAHARRTTWRYYLRLAATFLPHFSRFTGWRDLAGWENLKPVCSSALQIDRDLTDQQRTMVLDVSNVIQTRLNRYLAAATVLALGEDKFLADAVRDLTPKITALTELTAARPYQVDVAIKKAQCALEEFGVAADKCRK